LVAWAVLRALAFILWGFRTRGSDRVPKTGAVIIACNHISNWDPIFVGLACRREVHFLAKRELFANPLLGAFIRAYNALPVRRGVLDRRALRMAGDLLRRNGMMVMFPEGTRSRNGELGEARPGVGLIAALGGARVVPAHIQGSNALGTALTRRQPVTVAFGRPMSLEDPEGSAVETYRAFAVKVMNQIRELRPRSGPE
jgi:1-acyl-sn-glycerol-3-phosphate acyltransferase